MPLRHAQSFTACWDIVTTEATATSENPSSAVVSVLDSESENFTRFRGSHQFLEPNR
jgi:hypothetical protein